MRLIKLVGTLAAFVIVSTVLMAPATYADAWDKKTIMTTNQPLQICGKTFGAGKYVLRLYNSPSTRNVVHIFNADETQVLATIIAVPKQRMEPTGDTVFEFWEVPQGHVPALRAWFYPGDLTGQEFPRREAGALLSASVEQTAPVAATEVTETATVEPNVQQQEPTPAATTVPEEMARTTEPAEPAPAVEPSNDGIGEARQALPKTASPMPFVGLLGLLSLAGGSAISFFRR